LLLLSSSKLDVKWIVLALDGVGHGNQTFSGVVGIQNGMILSIQLEVEDLEVLLDALGI